MFKGKKRKIIAAVVAAVIILAVIIAVNIAGGGSAPPSVAAGTVEKMDLEQIVSVNGIIQGKETAEVTSSLNYEIVSILVEEGDQVEKGQVLAALDAEALLQEYRKASQALEEARFHYAASLRLYEEGAISQADYLRAKSTYETSKITADSYNVSDKTRITSPITGTVTRVNVSLGRYANDREQNKPMFVIEDLENLIMDVRISEYDISQIKEGQAVTITAEVLGRESVEGVVSRISPTGELKDAASKEMVIPVRIDINKSDVGLIAGVTAKARIQIAKKTNVLAVPIDSLLEDPDTGESYVMAVSGTTLKKVVLEPGIEGDFNMEILSGDLAEGDQVVLSPTFELTDGMEVLVLPKE